VQKGTEVREEKLAAHQRPVLLLVRGIPPIRSGRGPRRRRPAKLHTDKGYDHLRRWLRKRGIRHRIARKGIESSTRLGQHRWTIERTMCATRRSVCIPGSAGRNSKEVTGPDDLPGSER
jgi:hypothetical protein